MHLSHPSHPQPSPSPWFPHRQGWAQTLEGATGQQDREDDVSLRLSEQRNWEWGGLKSPSLPEMVAFGRSIIVLVTK